MTTTMTHDELARALEALDAYAGSDAGDVVKDRILALAGADTSRRLWVLAIARERWTSWDRANRILACVASGKAVESVRSRAARAVDSIIFDLSDRRGLSNEWCGLDEDIKQEIRESWTAEIEKAFGAP